MTRFLATAGFLLFVPYTFASASEVTAPECYSENDTVDLLSQYTGLGFETEPTVCRNRPMQHQVITALNFIAQLKFTQPNIPSGDDLSIPLIGDSWTEYLNANISEFAEEKTCREGMIAYVLGDHPIAHIMHVCPVMGDVKQVSMVVAIMAIMHEAWHVYSPVDHVVCNSGPASARSFKACDESVQARGAYAVTIEVLAKLANHALNISPVFRMEARSSMLAYAMTSFNVTPSIHRGMVPMLLTTDGLLTLDAPEHFYPLKVKVPMGVLMAKASGDLVLLPTDGLDDFEQMSTVGTFEWDIKNPDLIQSTFQSFSVSEKQSVRGVHYGNPISVILKTRSAEIFCTANGELDEIGQHRFTVNTRRSDYVSLVYPAGFNSASSSVTLQNDKGEWQDVSCSKSGQAKFSPWRPATYKGVKKVMKIGDVLYALTPKGGFYRQVNLKGKRQFTRETTDAATIFDFFQRDWIQFVDGE